MLRFLLQNVWKYGPPGEIKEHGSPQPSLLRILGLLVKHHKALRLPPTIVNQRRHILRRFLAGLQLDNIQTGIHTAADAAAADDVDSLRIHTRVNEPRSHYSAWLVAGPGRRSLHALLKAFVREPVRRA